MSFFLPAPWTELDWLSWISPKFWCLVCNRGDAWFRNLLFFGKPKTSTLFGVFGLSLKKISTGDMPGLHFEDTCVTDDDCTEFPETVCQWMPVNTGLDPGTRALDYNQWKEVFHLLIWPPGNTHSIVFAGRRTIKILLVQNRSHQDPREQRLLRSHKKGCHFEGCLLCRLPLQWSSQHGVRLRRQHGAIQQVVSVPSR